MQPNGSKKIDGNDQSQLGFLSVAFMILGVSLVIGGYAVRKCVHMRKRATEISIVEQLQVEA